jgi:undecaprenyl-diphosphatase
MKILDKKTILLISINILSLIFLIKIIEDVITDDFIVNIDLLLIQSIKLLWNPILNTTMMIITNIISPIGLSVLTTILFLILFHKREYNKSLLLILSLTLGLLSELLIKQIIHRIRPEDNLIFVTGYSFPSGHATMATIFFLILIYTFKDEIKNKILKYCFIVSSIILAVLVCLSRVYLNVHWFSDVLAGFILGIFWTTLLVIILKIYTKKNYIF